jgi:hypothetical protein
LPVSFFRILDNGQSPKIQKSQVLYTTVGTLQNLFVTFLFFLLFWNADGQDSKRIKQDSRIGCRNCNLIQIFSP